MTLCLFVSDLHGSIDKYEKLFDVITSERPSGVFLGGDLLPSGMGSLVFKGLAHRDFVSEYLVPEFSALRRALGSAYPRVFVILGNDDPRSEEAAVRDAAGGVWDYVHDSNSEFGAHMVFGYSYVPPTPFLLKDWERYDVSRFVDPGCVHPDEGVLSVPVPAHELQWSTIQHDLDSLTADREMTRAVLLFHTPPYQTGLDRAALDGQMVDHVPLDVHVGSIAVRRFIETRQPLLTLHGHVHESARLTGTWRERIGSTHAFSAAHDGAELALVRFKLEDLETATRELI